MTQIWDDQANSVDQMAAPSIRAQAEELLCDGYHLTVRYLAVRHQSRWALWRAYIGLWPRPSAAAVGFDVEIDGLRGEDRYLGAMSKEDALDVVERAISGCICLGESVLEFAEKRALVVGDGAGTDRWFYDLDISFFPNLPPPITLVQRQHFDQQQYHLTALQI